MSFKRNHSANWTIPVLAILLCCSAIIPATAQQSLSDQYGLAAGYYERQQYDQAITAFRDLIANYPSTRQSAMSYFFLGESFIQTGDYKSAYPAYEIFLTRLPKDQYAVRAKFRMAECAYRMKLDAQAVTLLEDFIQNHMDDELADYAVSYLGELRLRRSEPQLAVNVFELALRKFPSSDNAPRNRFSLAQSLLALGQFDQALKFFDLLAAAADNEFYSRAQMQIGIILLKKGEFNAAMEHLNIAAETLDDPAYLPEAKYWLAKCEIAAGNYQAALEQFTGAIELVENDDNKVAMLFDGAASAAKSGNTKIAVQWLDQLRRTWPHTVWSDDALQLSVEVNYQQRNFARALKDIEKFENQFTGFPNLPLITEYKGRIQYDQQQFKLSASTFNNLITRHGKDKTFSEKIDLWLYFRGLAELGLKEYDTASKTFSAVEMHGKEKEFIATVLLAEASCAIGRNKPEQAIAFFEQYLDTEPSGKSADRARSDLAIAQAQAESWPTCKKMLDEFATRHSDTDLYMETKLLVGEIALKKKRFDFAEQCFTEIAQSSNPRNFAVRGLSGVAWVRMSAGDEKSAVNVFEKLVKEHGESDLAAEAAMACGKYFEQHEKHKSAIDMYRHVLRHFGDSSFVAVAKLRLSYNLVKTASTDNLKEAHSILEEYLLSENQMLDEANYQLAWILQDTGRTQESKKLFQKIVDDYPHTTYWSDAVYRVAQQTILDQEYDKATALIAQVDTQETSEQLQNRFQFLEAQIAARQNRWIDVEAAMVNVLAKTDDEALRKKCRYWLAESLFHMESYDRAKTEFVRLIAVPKSITENRLAWANLRVAQCFGHLHDWSQALDRAVAGKAEFTKFDAGYEFDYVIGRSHAAQGRLTEARKSFEAVIQSPDGQSTQTAAMAQWRIGETYFHQQKYERAIEAFYRVDSLYAYEKWRAAALVEAGKCQEHLGNWNHAVKLYQQLIKKFPNSEFRIAAEKRMNLATRQAKRIETSTKK